MSSGCRAWVGGACGSGFRGLRFGVEGRLVEGLGFRVCGGLISPQSSRAKPPTLDTNLNDTV